jgi:hypothetical protein
MRWINDPAVVTKTPIVAIPLFCWFSVKQTIQMWTEHTAAGQNLAGWLSLWLALVMFLNLYRVCCPKEKFAFWGTMVEIIAVSMGTLTVLHFRYLVGH